MNSTTHRTLTPKLPHKRQVVTQHLRELAATLTPGTRLPSVNELERTFGYANSTIESALNELRREGVITRRQGSGTFVADAGGVSPEPIPTLRNRLIMISANTRSALYQAEMLHRLEAELQCDEFAPVLVFEANPEQRFARMRQYAKESGAQGYIHVGSTDYVGQADVPGIIIGEMPDSLIASQVVVDNYRAGQTVGEYLLKLGHRRVLFLGGPSYSQIGKLRYAGLRNAYARNGAESGVQELATLTHDQLYNVSPERMRQEITPYFQQSEPPTALFGVDDSVALQALRVLHLMGIRVPDEVSVVGFNDCSNVCAQVTPSLTTVRMPCVVLVSLAVQMLREHLKNPDSEPRHFRIPAELTVRESTGPAPGNPVSVIVNGAV